MGRPRDIAPALPNDIQVGFKDLDECDRDNFLAHFLQHSVAIVKQTGDFSAEEAKFEVLRSKVSSDVVVRFASIQVARLFYGKFQGYHMVVNGRSVFMELQNGLVKEALMAPGRAVMLKNATRIKRDVLDSYFRNCSVLEAGTMTRTLALPPDPSGGW